MLSTLLIVLALSYSAMMITFAVAASRSHYPFDRNYKPTVSIIIAARNEEASIGRCLESMTRLVYPRERLEVIVVDDQSTDRTGEIVRSYTQQDSRIRLVIAMGGSGQLFGKANALSQGIESSVAEILLFTDADCIVPVGWVAEVMKYFAEESVGLVAGFTYLNSKGMFEAIQTLDWFALFSAAAGAIRLGIPITAIGNNLSVRRKAYDQVGGFENIPFSVTEDHALFKAIVTKTAFISRFPLDPHMLIESQPCRKWSELLLQKRRWFTGGLKLESGALVVIGLIFMFKALLLFSILADLTTLVLAVMLLTALSEIMLTLPATRTFRKQHFLRWSPAFVFYFTMYILLIPLLVLAERRVKWKGRNYSATP